MLIVPDGDSLTIEAKIAPHDIDQGRVGQRAVVRFSAFNQRTTPEMNGEVTRIGADVTQDDRKQETFYAVRIRIPDSELARLEGLQPVAGMPVEVFMQTSSRTVVSYLTKPLREQVDRTFRGRCVVLSLTRAQRGRLLAALRPHAWVRTHLFLRRPWAKEAPAPSQVSSRVRTRTRRPRADLPFCSNRYWDKGHHQLAAIHTAEERQGDRDSCRTACRIPSTAIPRGPTTAPAHRQVDHIRPTLAVSRNARWTSGWRSTASASRCFGHAKPDQALLVDCHATHRIATLYQRCIFTGHADTPTRKFVA